MPEFDVFLSYSTADTATAGEIFKELSARGLKVWFDKQQISVGDNVDACIRDGLEKSLGIVVLLGKKLGDWQKGELNNAVRSAITGRILFPVLLPGSSPDKLPLLLEGIHHLDLRQQGIAAEGMERLCDVICSRINPGRDALIRELHSFERDFVQVLLYEFSLFRKDSGVRLEVSFDHRSQAVATRKARTFVREHIKDFVNMGKEIKNNLADVYSGTRQVYNHPPEKEFPFRFASGGSLPILDIDGVEYYCLFLRGIKPIGWNLANGGCNSVEELYDPTLTILRELREELIIVDAKKWYSFGPSGRAMFERPEFAVARDYWNNRFDEVGALRFEQLMHASLPDPITEGPDELDVNFLKQPRPRLDSLFVSVTPEDYGIEVDRVLKIEIPDQGLILCDGELNGPNSVSRTVNRPVGLFRVDAFHETEHMTPDLFFYNARRFPGSEFADVIKSMFIKDLKNDPGLTEEQIRDFANMAEKGFPLCPVTSHLIARARAFAP